MHKDGICTDCGADWLGEHYDGCSADECLDCRKAQATVWDYWRGQPVYYTQCGDCGSDGELERFYGGSGPVTEEEMHREAYRIKESLR